MRFLTPLAHITIVIVRSNCMSMTWNKIGGTNFTAQFSMLRVVSHFKKLVVSWDAARGEGRRDKYSTVEKRLSHVPPRLTFDILDLMLTSLATARCRTAGLF
jgi:hypothetical protein